jgi:SAM-dependent methyltransferase
LDEVLSLRRSERFPTGWTGLSLHMGHWDAPPDGVPSAEETALAQIRLTDRLLEMAGIAAGSSVLDAGCGIGGTLARIDERFERMRLAGLDLSAERLAVAREEIRPRPSNELRWVLGDACRPPFSAGSFDAVLAVECAFHFESRALFLKEAARLLKPGGRLALSDWTAAPGLADRLKTGDPALRMSEEVVRGLCPWPDFSCREGAYERLAEAAGLRLESNQDATEATLPSYALWFSQAESDPGAASKEWSPFFRAWLKLGLLQKEGLVRMRYLGFRKP